MSKFLLELKNRLILIVFSFTLLNIIFYTYKEFFFYLLLNPTRLSTKCVYFISTDVTEIFYTYIYLIVSLNFYVLLYYVIYHFFYFFGPALFKSEFKIVKFVCGLSLFFFIVSVLISYFFGISNTWLFFLNFQNSSLFFKKKIYFEVSIKEYVKFCMDTFYYFFACFQALVLFISFYMFNRITIAFVKKFRKLHYFLCFIFSLLISPPDLFMQVVLCIFILMVYELCNLFFLLVSHLQTNSEAN
jgi:sec-independent protein translocase protein TatC